MMKMCDRAGQTLAGCSAWRLWSLPSGRCCRAISTAPMGEAIRGILPFLVLLLIVLSIIIFVPALTLWLPNAMLGP